jgi:predicted RNase H-like nuclease (RuvC/YqgF family)
MKNIFYRVTLVTIALSATVLYAGNGSNFGASFGGSFAGSMLGNALTQPRSTRTEVVQVPVQQAAPAPRDDYDDSAALRKLRKENKALVQEIDELSDEVAALKRENRKLKEENKRLEEKTCRHHTKTVAAEPKSSAAVK